MSWPMDLVDSLMDTDDLEDGDMDGEARARQPRRGRRRALAVADFVTGWTLALLAGAVAAMLLPGGGR